MKITKVSMIFCPHRLNLLNTYQIVKIETDEGITGYGESGITLWGAAAEKAVEHLSEILIGEDPFSTERIWQHMFRGSFFPAEGIYSCAISAIDIALWDIKGKALNMPLYKLLGGPVRNKVVSYTHIAGNTPDILAENAKKAVKEGWKFIRWSISATQKSGKDKEVILEPVEAIKKTVIEMAKIREAVGPDIEICLDVHTRLDTAHSITLCKQLEPYNPFFIEDPLRSENPGSYKTLERHVNVPIAAGEQWTSKWKFREVIEEELIRYARIDICNVGGITEALKIAHWCETHYIDVVPHNPLGPINTAACTHLCMALTNVGVTELTAKPGSVETEIFPSQMEWENGYVFSNEKPGLGIEINEKKIKEYSGGKSKFAPVLRRNDGSFTNW